MKGSRPRQAVTVREALRRGTALLHGAPQPFLETKTILMTITGIDEVGLFASPDRALSPVEERRFFRLIACRLSGRPLAYLTGRKEFWSLIFRVAPGVLIPRPESELLVEAVLGLPRHPGETIADIGTGSGNIAVALARELPQARIVATDISAKALKLAEFNARQNGAARVVFRRGSLFRPLSDLGLGEACDALVSNPPYISREDWIALPSEVRDHEPRRALFGGPTGLEFMARLVRGAPSFLRPGGSLIFEIGEGQEKGATALFGRRWTGVRTLPDLRGIPRVVQAVRI